MNKYKYLIILPILLICMFLSCTQDELNLNSDANKTTDKFNISVEHKEQFKEDFKLNSQKIRTLTSKKADIYTILESIDVKTDDGLDDFEKFKTSFVLLSMSYDSNFLKDKAYRKSIEKDINDHPNLKSIYQSIIEIKEASKNFQIKDTNTEIPFGLLDEVPHPSSCKGLALDELKKCTSDYISSYVNQNFDTSKFKNLTSGKHRVIVQFKIDKDGKVYNVKSRGPSIELEAEAITVVESLPNFNPGTIEGEAVRVIYTFPINFIIQ